MLKNVLILVLLFAPVLMFVSRSFEGEMWTGQGGYSTKFHIGRLSLEVQPLTLLYTIFDRESTAFMYLPLTNGTPFVYLV